MTSLSHFKAVCGFYGHFTGTCGVNSHLFLADKAHCIDDNETVSF